MYRYLSLIPLLFALMACRPAPIQQQESYVFGTRVEVLVVDEDPTRGREAIAAVLREFDRLHRQFHAWQPSELTALNKALASGKAHTVSPELADYLREAQAIAHLSNGLFDPGIGQLIQLWGFQSDEFIPRLPDAKTLAEWQQARPGMSHLNLKGLQVSSSSRQIAVDFGGYLKGVALDRAAQLLKAQGINHALINIGGNVMALGSKQGTPWKVGIQHPRQPGPIATLALQDGEAIGTSGDYQRFFELNGQRYCHLLDPRTAYPITHTAGVTVLIPKGEKSGMRSDALSKPIFIAGPGQWPAMAEKLGVRHVLRVGTDGKIELTEALASRLTFTGKKPELHILP